MQYVMTDDVELAVSGADQLRDAGGGKESLGNPITSYDPSAQLSSVTEKEEGRR